MITKAQRPLALLAFLSFLAIPLLSLAAKSTVTARVMKVTDGDTIIVSPIEGGAFFKCRLYGIDAPETNPPQAFGEEAARELKDLILGQTVDVTLTGQKTHNREVCIIDKNGRDINREMVRRGYAWAYREHLKRPYESEYISAEEEARAKRLGLWQQANPQPPWDFRKQVRGR